jgi:hypothetical protein
MLPGTSTGGQAKKSPGRISGLSLREEGAPRAETKKAGNCRPPSLHAVVALVATAARLVGRKKPDALALRMSDVAVDRAVIMRRRYPRGALHRCWGTRVDGARRDVVGVNVAVGRPLGSVSRTDAKTEGGGGKKHGLHDHSLQNLELSFLRGLRYVASHQLQRPGDGIAFWADNRPLCHMTYANGAGIGEAQNAMAGVSSKPIRSPFCANAPGASGSATSPRPT